MFNQALDMYNLRSHGAGHPDRHIVGVRPHPTPEISVFDHSNGTLFPLPIDELSMTLSHDTMCVGRFGAGSYVPCPHKQRTGKFGMCPDCGSVIIPHQQCIFEPKCEGEVCGEGICTAETAVYLAFFGIHAKIGMSTAARVDTRVREQGADGYSIVATVPNRLRARRLERSIAGMLNVRQGFRSESLLALLTEELDVEGMERSYVRLAERIGNAFHLSPTPLRRIEYDLPLLDHVPTLLPTPGRHEGRYIGGKGRFIIYNDGSLKALKLREMEGRFLLDVL